MHSTRKVELTTNVSELQAQIQQKESARIAAEKRHQEEIEGLKGQLYQRSVDHEAGISALTSGHYAQVQALHGRFDDLKNSHGSELQQRNLLL
jgi:hypothetical protein